MAAYLSQIISTPSSFNGAGSSRLACHPGVQRTLALIHQWSWWSSMEEDTSSHQNHLRHPCPFHVSRIKPVKESPLSVHFLCSLPDWIFAMYRSIPAFWLLLVYFLLFFILIQSISFLTLVIKDSLLLHVSLESCSWIIFVFEQW